MLLVVYYVAGRDTRDTSCITCLLNNVPDCFLEREAAQNKLWRTPMTAVPARTYTTLSSRGLRHDILPMRLYHKAKKLGIWDPRDIDLTQDRQDWQEMSTEKQDQLRGLIMAFQAGEEAVTVDLLPL